jgi:hypothetical protein
LRNAEFANGGQGRCDPYCTVEVISKPRSKIQTQVCVNTLNPEWMHEAEIVDYAVGDALVFTVLDNDRVHRDDFLGRAVLQCETFHPAGFEGEVLLQDAVSKVKAYLKIRISAAGWAYGDKAFFSAHWRTGAMGIGGMRNDFAGEVGYRFVPRTPLVVNAVGRQINAGLAEQRPPVMVTLWSAETQEALAQVEVGPNSSAAEPGFAFGLLAREVLLEAGKEYRLTQRCFANMPDYWFDGAITPAELSMWSATHCAEYMGSVFGIGDGYPNQVDTDGRIPTMYRRAGMLNFRMRGEDPALEGERRRNERSLVRRGDRRPETLGGADHEDMLQIRLVCMSPAPMLPSS